MAIRREHSTSREAQTFYEVVERFDGFAAIRALPKTGRTHQIRLHLVSIGCPVLCDRLYGGRATITRGEIRRDPSDDGPCYWTARRCTPADCNCATRRAASRWSSSPRCRPTSKRVLAALRELRAVK